MTVVPEPFERYGEERLGQAPAFGPGKDGVFEATLAREPGGETRLLSDYAKVPYHLTGALDTDPAPGLATLCLQEPTGGVAQGDRHALSIDARARARAHVTTQSATKVHSMHSNYAHLDGTLRAGEEAHLEYLPGPTIVNEGARCLQTLSVELDPTASAIVSDVFVPDGLTGQEPFGFDHYHSRLEARCEGQLVCSDAVDLRPTERDPRDPAAMGEFGVVGTLYVLAPAEPTAEIADPIHDRVAETDGTRAGVSALAHDAGVSVRVLGERSTDVVETVSAAWDEARRALLGVGAPKDRRY
ncbi:urease accessory protein UreD [Natronomonas sp.]|uniref:urease accessory protein UreD n=1 Tax=Natronomonas sp. TaxID=2184060 RepID=UPI002632CEF4|nr:urease accessory protein UreD [Natronomonas sp.]